MNCQLCQQNLEAYRQARLPGRTMNLVKEHLEGCGVCSEIFRLETLAAKTMEHEKEMTPGVFTSRLIMDRINGLNDHQTAAESRGILRPVMIAASLAAALFAGILIGNLYQPSAGNSQEPEELRLMNDTEMESLIYLLNE